MTSELTELRWQTERAVLLADGMDGTGRDARATMEPRSWFALAAFVDPCRLARDSNDGTVQSDGTSVSRFQSACRLIRAPPHRA
jgi:hypothetical protein